MNANEQIFITQREVVRAGFVGEYRELYQSDVPVTTTDSIHIRFAMKDLKRNASNVGGFTQANRQ